MSISLETLIFLAGLGHGAILIASAMVPSQLNWKEELAPLSRLNRQMHWVYGGYIVLSIIAFGLISMFCADELADGSNLARAFSAYVAIFWGIRLSLQWVFDVKEHLKTVWHRMGYHALTLLVTFLTCVFGYVAIFS